MTLPEIVKLSQASGEKFHRKSRKGVTITHRGKRIPFCLYVNGFHILICGQNRQWSPSVYDAIATDYELVDGGQKHA